MKGVPRWDSLEVLSVGLPFCVFKIAAGAALRPGAWGAAGLVLLRRRVLDACFLSFGARLLLAPARKSRRRLQDFGNSLDVLISFSLVAYMVGAGRLKELPPQLLAFWNAAVVLNVLGAGLGRFTESYGNLSRDGGSIP